MSEAVFEMIWFGFVSAALVVFVCGIVYSCIED